MLAPVDIEDSPEHSDETSIELLVSPGSQSPGLTSIQEYRFNMNSP